MSDRVTIELSRDEALVLSHMFWRFECTDRLSLAHNAEFVAIGSIAAQLAQVLAEPFMEDYAERVLEAREGVARDYEGLAPGVDPQEDDLA